MELKILTREINLINKEEIYIKVIKQVRKGKEEIQSKTKKEEINKEVQNYGIYLIYII